MRRLDMIASMAKTGDEMSLTDKEAIIQVIETKRSQTRTYFDNLGYEIMTKTKRGLDVIGTYREVSDKIEKQILGWNGFIALIMATWFFTDCITEMGARKWISRNQERSYIEKLKVELYVRIRSTRWEIIRKENWNALTRHIKHMQSGSTHIETFAIAAGIIALTVLKLKYKMENCTIFEMSL